MDKSNKGWKAENLKKNLNLKLFFLCELPGVTEGRLQMLSV